MKTSTEFENTITRRNFMKKTILTTGAVMLLAQGVGLANGSSGSGGYTCIFSLRESVGAVTWDGVTSPAYKIWLFSKICG